MQIVAELARDNSHAIAGTKLDDDKGVQSRRRNVHARNIDLEEFERCDGAERLYVLHRDLGEWYFSFPELATVVSREVHPDSLL